MTLQVLGERSAQSVMEEPPDWVTLRERLKPNLKEAREMSEESVFSKIFTKETQVVLMI